MSRVARTVFLAIICASIPCASPNAQSFDGEWSVLQVCEATQEGAKGFTWRYGATVKNGHFVGQYRNAGQSPSMTLDGVREEIASESLNYLKVARVKLDHSPNLGLWYGIRCIPTFLCFIDGEERIGIFGTTSKEAILSQLRPVINRSAIG